MGRKKTRLLFPGGEEIISEQILRRVVHVSFFCFFPYNSCERIIEIRGTWVIGGYKYTFYNGPIQTQTQTGEGTVTRTRTDAYK